MIVGLDPETGQLGPPTPEQRAELEQIAASRNALLSRSSVGLVEESRPDGTIHVNLQGRFQEYATIRIGPDGRKTFACVDDTTGLSKDPNPRAAGTASSIGATASPAGAAPIAEER